GVRPAGVGGRVAADGARPLAGRVRGKVVAVRLEQVGQLQIDDARLDDGVAVADVNLVDLLHAGERDHDAAADRQGAAGEAGPGPAGDERHVQLVAQFHDRRDLLGGGREGDDGRAVLGDGERVALVDGQFRRGGD